MKLLKGGAFVALGLMAFSSAIAQKVKLIEGDLSALKNNNDQTIPDSIINLHWSLIFISNLNQQPL